MTDLKYSILGVLYYKQPRQDSRINLINRKFANPSETNYAINELVRDKLLAQIVGSDKIELLPSGATAYEEAKEKRHNQAEQKRQQRFDNKVSIANVLVPLITFFVGIFVESQVDIVGWFLSLFK